MATTREQALARSIERLSARSFELLIKHCMDGSTCFTSANREHLRQKLLQYAQENYFANSEEAQ